MYLRRPTRTALLATLVFLCTIFISSCTSNENIEQESEATHMITESPIPENVTTEPTETNNSTAPESTGSTASGSAEQPTEKPVKEPDVMGLVTDPSLIDPYAFFVGRVVMDFDAETREINAIDLTKYIDRNNKTIESQTGELFWDYENGIVKYDTPYFQGALGFYQGTKIELTNIDIETENEYITVACVPLDGKPLSESEKILLQVMTEDFYTGYRAEDGIIQSVGTPPIRVKDIKLKITFKNLLSRHASRVDENGNIFLRNTIENDGTFTLELARDAVYTILTVDEAEGDDVLYSMKKVYGDSWSFETTKDPFVNSALDLSFLNEDIAGQGGFVKKDGDQFLLGDGTPVKFWAVNVGPDIIKLPKEEIDYLVKRLAKLGVNMVRLHGRIYEWDWGYNLVERSELIKVSPEYLDQYHYLITALKNEGIYTKLSFYFPLWVEMKETFNFEGYDSSFEGANPFALLMINSEFQDIYKSWAESLLLPTNPYTGVPLAEEPAVAIVEIQNEDNYLFWTFTRDNIPEAQMNILEDRYTQHLITKYGSFEAVVEAWGGKVSTDTDTRFTLLNSYHMTANGYDQLGGKERASDQLQFLTEAQFQFYEEMADFYRNTIKTKSLISASNWVTADERIMEGLERYTYTPGDVIDRHGYFEEGHTGDTASWRVMDGHTYTDMSATLNPSKAIIQNNAVKGYPHIITETAWPMPNRFNGESVPMWTLYGALQGMDGIFMFTVGGSDWETNVTAKWPLFVPSVAGQFPAFALMYRRGYIQEADVVVDVSYSLSELYDYQGMVIYQNAALDNLRSN